MKKNTNRCFVCNSEITGELYRCADEDMCSEKCCNKRLMFIKNIDPYLMNPYIWNNPINYENKLGNIYEEQCENNALECCNRYEYDCDKKLYCVSLNRRKCFDKLFLYLYMVVGIIRQVVY